MQGYFLMGSTASIGSLNYLYKCCMSRQTLFYNLESIELEMIDIMDELVLNREMFMLRIGHAQFSVENIFA